MLQEVAAARHVLIMCGSTTIDGYAFCLGLQSLQLSYDARPDLRNRILSVTYLIRGSIFRSEYTTSSSGEVSLGIRPLGELIDMYHAHEASERRDKVFALRGMSSDDSSAAHLLPNYDIPWEDLFRQLVEFLLGRQVSVEILAHPEIAAIKSKGCIIGRVSSEGDPDRYDRQQVVITPKDVSGHMGPGRKWTLQASAKSIQVGDLVCFLQGAPKPTVIRPCKDHFYVIITAPSLGMENGSVGQQEQTIVSFQHDFLLVWAWERFQGKLQDREFETLINSPVPQHSNREMGGHSDKMTRLWNVALILEDAGEYEKAEERLREAVESYERGFGKENLNTLIGVERLALLYKKMKQWEKAEERLKQLIQTRNRCEGLTIQTRQATWPT